MIKRNHTNTEKNISPVCLTRTCAYVFMTNTHARSMTNVKCRISNFFITPHESKIYFDEKHVF